jgi:chemotaxis protein methyltransferase CheR
MTSKPRELDLAEVAAIVESRLGLHFPEARWKDLHRNLEEAARRRGGDEAEFAKRLRAGRLSSADLDVLTDELTVGETYFFREQAVFDALEHHVLPPLIAARRRLDRRLRFWCAGCCTGEEPYSLAILLERLLPDIDTWNVLILATDLNPHFLRKASAGVYKEWSFRESEPALKERYFRQITPERYEIHPRIRRRVTFAPLNLVAEGYPSPLNSTDEMDLILCRNVLMYFSERWMQRVIQRFHECLVMEGWLVVSSTETSQQFFRKFQPVHAGRAVLYRKVHDRTMLRDVQPAAVPAAELAGSVRHPRLADLGDVLLPGRAATASSGADTLPAEAPPDYLQQARRAANGGHLKEALDWCDRALAEEKLDLAAHYLRALVLRELGRSEESTAALKKVLYLDPRFVLAHFALAHQALQEGNEAVATRRFSDALELLKNLSPDEELPESDGLTVGRLAEIVRHLLEAPSSA